MRYFSFNTWVLLLDYDVYLVSNCVLALDLRRKNSGFGN